VDRRGFMALAGGSLAAAGSGIPVRAGSRELTFLVAHAAHGSLTSPSTPSPTSISAAMCRMERQFAMASAVSTTVILHVESTTLRPELSNEAIRHLPHVHDN
jgi:hypothetical protein